MATVTPNYLPMNFPAGGPRPGGGMMGKGGGRPGGAPGMGGKGGGSTSVPPLNPRDATATASFTPVQGNTLPDLMMGGMQAQQPLMMPSVQRRVAPQLQPGLFNFMSRFGG